MIEPSAAGGLQVGMPDFHASMLDCGCGDGAALEDRIAALVARVAGRDREAFVALFRLAAPRCKALFLARGAPEPVADELAQETMAAVWRDAAAYDPARPGGALAWMYALGRDRFLAERDRYLDRVAWEQGAAAPDAGGPAPDRDGPAEAARALRRLRRALALLPAPEAAVLRAVFVRGLSHGAVAGALGMPLGTVKTRLRRAVRFLRARVADPPE